MPADPDSAPVVVVGGGWAGLAAAVELTARGVPVTLFESSRQLGGRARRLAFGDVGVDNGQHLLIGAYRETLRLMSLVGVTEASACRRLPLRLEVSGKAGHIALAAPRLPAPLHLAAALLTARGLSIGERMSALRFALRHYLRGFRLTQDTSVATLLADQPPRLVRLLWEPLCLATLNTSIDQASAQVFLRVLRDAFALQRTDSDLLVPCLDLGRSFPEPAMDFIERHGGRARLGRRVTSLDVVDGRVAGVRVDGEPFPARAVVLAVPAPTAARLLAPHALGERLALDIASLAHEPLATIYLRYAPTVALPTEMVGLDGMLSQWLFDRRIYGQHGLMASVISGPGRHMEMSREALADAVAQELSAHFGWPRPLEVLVVREKRATFRCEVDVNRRRPAATTPIEGCVLAGDYTATGYPATLEGAVRSGVECARLVSAQLGTSS